MTGREKILRLASLYGEALGLERTTVSWRLFQDTNKLDALEGGRDLFLGRYESAMLFFSRNWPAHVSWPAGIERPTLEAIPA